jgi:nicotinamidase-related amidase
MSDGTAAIEPRTSILLVMDYQPGIIGRLEDGDAQVERARRALELARGAGMHVGYVHVAFTPGDAAAVPAINELFSRAAASMPADAPANQVDERLAPQDGDVVVRKVRTGAFSTTDLADQLRERGVDTLVLAGISTSGCVLSTVRDAFDHDYRLVVLSDGCADPDPEVHRMLLERVFPRQAAVLTIDELGQALGG